jgi:polysaccharide export outer membrane protein
LQTTTSITSTFIDRTRPMNPRPLAIPRFFATALLVLTISFLGMVLLPRTGHAQTSARNDYALGAGDSIRVQVFQNPDLSMETRLSENGVITYPLIGAVDLNGLSVSAAESKISAALKSGGFLQNPQITISLVQVRNNQISVLGQVAKPGRFPLETAGTRVTDMLATAGGVIPGGDDWAILTGTRGGKPFRERIDIPAIYLQGNEDKDTVLEGGDTLYVHRAAVFYIYGEAQHSGAYRIERDMTVMQAMALGGGPTNRGSENRLRLHRKAADGHMQQIDPQLSDAVLPNDVLYIKESIF